MTCLQWKPLLAPDDRKDIIVKSLEFLVNDQRVWVYGFVIMPNHMHLLWCRRDEWAHKSVTQMLLKYTAQQIKFGMINTGRQRELELYRSTQHDRQYHFWERRSYSSHMFNRRVAYQKLDYMHYNPVKAGLCSDMVDYRYSSARYYELNEDQWPFLTDIKDHL